MDSGPDNREPPKAQRRKPREGRKCPECGSDHVVCNGGYKTERFGAVKRLICYTCENTWEEREKSSELFAEARFMDSDTSVVQAFALVTMGLPVSQVEGLMQQKQETLCDRLLWCAARQEVWTRLARELTTRYKILREEVTGLASLLSNIKSGRASFHALSRRQAAVAIRPPARSG